MNDLLLMLICTTLAFMLGYVIGRLQGNSTQSRALSPSAPPQSPTLARRAERIARNAIHTEHSTDTQSRVISPRKKAQSNIIVE